MTHEMTHEMTREMKREMTRHPATRHRNSGVVLLLVVFLGAGTAALGARNLLTISPADQDSRVDALVHLVETMRTLSDHQERLRRQMGGYIYPHRQYLPSVQDALKRVYQSSTGSHSPSPGLKEWARSAYSGGNSRIERPPFSTRTRPADTLWNSVRDDRLKRGAEILKDDYALPPVRANSYFPYHNEMRWFEYMVQTIYPADLGYTQEVLNCQGVCWDILAITDDDGTRTHFWLDVGNSNDLRLLLQRLRTSRLAGRAIFCPVSRAEIGDALTDPAIISFPVLCNGAEHAAASGRKVDTALRKNMLPKDGQTVLLGNYKPENRHTRRVTHNEDVLVLKPTTILHNIKEISAYRLQPFWLHPFISSEEMIKRVHPTADYVYQAGRYVRKSRGADPPTFRYEGKSIQIQPFVDLSAHRYATGWYGSAGSLPCYSLRPGTGRHHMPTLKSPSWKRFEFPHMPLPCPVEADKLQYLDFDDNYRKWQLGQHRFHATVFDFADNRDIAYPPQLNFAPNTAVAPRVQGSIIAKWLKIRHLMGAVYILPGVGPRPHDSDITTTHGRWIGDTSSPSGSFVDFGDYDQDLDWQGMGSCDLITEEGCARLTIEPGAVVFSEHIVKYGTAAVAQTLPVHGQFWSGAEAADEALATIRPYRYRYPDGKPSIGLLAQEVRGYYPQTVHDDSKGTLALAYYSLLPVLHRQLQQLRQAHQSRMASLRARIAQLRQPEQEAP